MNAFKDTYQPQVIANAKAFAKALVDEGLEVEGDPEVGYTETHQVVVFVGYAQGCAVAKELEESNIILNYQAIPSDESFTSSSGLRMGILQTFLQDQVNLFLRSGCYLYITYCFPVNWYSPEIWRCLRTPLPFDQLCIKTSSSDFYF